ncbi:2-amino-3-ketobutyrate coenzyme A ligase, mitochondrial [Lepeophtheirus salmonis]|uniref:2-amino-3-ketobutyrate coenzyme A ligase, mitochondrial n=1 Tax=Lepeophtheirus salmonis TaxID=72036 RepID=UPI001AE28F2A|nr:2-amino-3-ketobutyrate coenzyme A ligase, mitochondrial-like [Lepeophtheirus salmonis]
MSSSVTIRTLSSNRFFCDILRHTHCYVPRPMSSSSSSAMKIVNARLDDELEEIRSAGTWKTERVITSKQDINIRVDGCTGPILNFCANNYLGLSCHPQVVSSGKMAMDSHGAGLSSVRFICGTQNIHKELEDKISRFHGREDTILYASCYDANAGLFEQLLGPEDAVLSDSLNHASIIDGIRLCKAKKYRYAHKDMKDLESKLRESKDARSRLIVTDGVFSMDGNVAPLPDIVELADKYKALIFMDECHATGFFGQTGRGTEEFFGLEGKVDIINSTLGKALGGASGGYTTASKQLVDLLRQRSRPYLFSNSIPPAVVASASKVFDILMSDSSLVKKIQGNTSRFRSKMTQAGFTLSGDDHPICPVMIGDAKLASDFADLMLEKGIYVIGFSFPVVPKGKARIRVQISAAHTTDDIDKTVDAFISIGKHLQVIS